MNRRDLVQKIVLGGTVLVFIPSVLENCTKSAVTDIVLDLSLAENSSLNNTGGSKIVQNVLIINTGGGNIVALSKICTHEGCTVGYDAGAGNIKCPCHGAVFTTSGSVVSGPARTALKSYVVSKTDNILTISL